MEPNSRTTSHHFVLGGLALAILIWVLDAADDAYFHGVNYMDSLLHPGAMEILARGFVSLCCIILGLITAALFKQKEDAEVKLDRNRNMLHELVVQLNEQNEARREEIRRREAIEVQLEKLVVTDQLTGAFNRRKFDETLIAEMKLESRVSRGLSLIILDIDHFKLINDNHGHETGDKVLKELVKVIQGGIRQADFFFRIGGEEFALVSYAEEPAQLETFAEKIRAEVSAHEFPRVGRVTISIGAGQYQPGDDYSRLYKRADKALYAAKEQGRNRVIVAQAHNHIV